MKRKLILTAVPAIAALCALVGCGGQSVGNPVIPDSGEFDLSKATITGAEAQVTAELGTRYIVPVPQVEYNGTNREVTFAVFDSENAAVDLIARGTRFYVDSVNDYKINYYITYLGESKLVASSNVTVVDTQGPEIILPASAYTMTVYKDSTVNIPVPTVRDGSGHVESTGVKVTFKGEAVEIKAGAESELGSFTAANYGEYVIEYTATDGSDNTTVEPVTVNCARMITLCDFENTNNSYASGNKYVTEHAYSGNALQVTSNGATDYQMIAAYTPYYNLSGFDSFAINVWSSRDCTASNDGFYLLNHLYRLREGDNIILIDRETFVSQYPNAMIPSTLRPNYRDLMYVYFQICGEDLTVVIDNFVGIFDNYEADEDAPTIDFGKEHSLGEITLDDGKEFVLPASVTAYDNSMENCTIDYSVKKTDGTDITAEVKAGFRVSYGDGRYIVTYSATDAAGNTGTRDFTVNVRALDIAAGDDAPENRGYITLQNFDTLDGVVAEGGGMVLSLEEALARKDKAVKVTSPDGDAELKIRLLKDGNALTAEDLKTIAYLQVSVISDSDNVP
ncbi:MAG: DUF5011 domain-containing protein, partial [Clostridia bacterium]|nr:DUF5011 domain-containing protein [Clostridia bacterium]